jgi:hypothetical protein
MVEGTFLDSFRRTPQGGIASPILFNIYMNEFDKFIKFDPKIQNLLIPREGSPIFLFFLGFA